MSEKVHDLHTFMAQVALEMASEYKRIFEKTAEDPGTAGDEGEENWATLLREWLPPHYFVTTKGRIIGTDGRMSPQIDVLVLKPSYPLKLREKKVWLAGGVAAAFECKTTLRSEHIKASGERCAKFKALFPNRLGSPAAELRSPLIYGVLAHSHAWKAGASRPAENIETALRNVSEAANRPSNLIDLVCVADVGTWAPLLAACYRASWMPNEEQALRTLFGGEWGVGGSLSGATVATDGQKTTFQPIGAMICTLTRRLAQTDPSIRDIADYYRLTDLMGNGSGGMQFWPPSVFSAEVRQGIDGGRLLNTGTWDEWEMASF
ncbi:DUF6602 domain-containing protein [Sphingobium sp.]|uniref:DUF6602 domain-containing protein n=1 Tax=Sphingobium sp. TaxID=1912891 RepID=UPI0035C6FC7F